MSDYLDFYSEKKFCRRCGRYVRSLSRSYCALCGEAVNLFSKEDWQKFRRRTLPNKKKSSFLAPISKKGRPAAERG